MVLMMNLLVCIRMMFFASFFQQMTLIGQNRCVSIFYWNSFVTQQNLEYFYRIYGKYGPIMKNHIWDHCLMCWCCYFCLWWCVWTIWYIFSYFERYHICFATHFFSIRPFNLCKCQTLFVLTCHHVVSLISHRIMYLAFLLSFHTTNTLKSSK